MSVTFSPDPATVRRDADAGRRRLVRDRSITVATAFVEDDAHSDGAFIVVAGNVEGQTGTRVTPDRRSVQAESERDVNSIKMPQNQIYEGIFDLFRAGRSKPWPRGPSSNRVFWPTRWEKTVPTCPGKSFFLPGRTENPAGLRTRRPTPDLEDPSLNESVSNSVYYKNVRFYIFFFSFF